MHNVSQKGEPRQVKSRNRSFRGCITCRASHIKCDETRPTCRICTDAGSECGGYTRRIFFDTRSNAVSRYRQMLFTDSERKTLNSHMLRAVPFHRTGRSLTLIDEWSTSNDDSEIHIGPFGAFRPLTLNNPTNVWEEDFGIPLTFEFNLEELAMTPFRRSPTPGTPVTFGKQVGEESLWQATFEHAPLLLKHYANTLIPMMTPIRHRKTPWHVLFLPSTKSTLATITLEQEVDAADLTIFFGTLALSAFALQTDRSGYDWTHVAQLFKTYAIKYLGITLTHALDLPKSFKYKSILMAILTMVQVSMADETSEQTADLLIAAEKVIRFRGLTKSKKSRKVRILHHCYAYARILQESISMISSRSPKQLELANAVEKSGVLVSGSDPPFFCLGLWKNLDEEFMLPKSWDVGENDLHLAKPGTWEATLYGEIFDVPETWLNLLSQTIRLANLKEMAEAMNSDIFPLGDFMARARALERFIASNSKATSPGQMQESNCADNVSFTPTVQHVLYSALLIYFYRRIYDVDVYLLQSQVTVVKNHLLASQTVCGGEVIDALVWPAFIAGCEAATVELQEFFSEVFDQVLLQNKRVSYRNMQKLMHKVWERRNVYGKHVTWIELMDHMQS